MSNIINVSSYASNTVNSIFKSLGTNQSSGLSSLLGDYYSIQNGSYLRMAKKYYANKSTGDSSTGSNNTTSKVDKEKLDALDGKTDKTSAGTASSDKSAGSKTDTMKLANTAVKSVGNLTETSLYNKVDKKNEDGTTTKDYDREAILSNLKTFVNDYNNLVKSAAASDNSATVQAGSRMTNQTAVYSSSLEDIGITIGKDNTLVLDDKKFGEADMTDVKSLFTGNVSFGKNTQLKMLQIYSADSLDTSNINGLYSSQATNNTYSVGNMIDSLF